MSLYIKNMSDRLTIEQRHNNMADCAYTQGDALG